MARFPSPGTVHLVCGTGTVPTSCAVYRYRYILCGCLCAYGCFASGIVAAVVWQGSIICAPDMQIEVLSLDPYHLNRIQDLPLIPVRIRIQKCWEIQRIRIFNTASWFSLGHRRLTEWVVVLFVPDLYWRFDSLRLVSHKVVADITARPSHLRGR